MTAISCLECGMLVSPGTRSCPKCHNDLASQHDGSTITVDIAHNGETAQEALQKMTREIEIARHSAAMRLRLVVGSGRIREAVLLMLGDMKFREEVVDFDNEPSNAGAIIVRLKK